MSHAQIENWIPTIEVESANGVREVQILTKMMGKRKIFLTGEVNMDMANKFMAQMMYLTDSDEPIDIYINSPGGSVDAGMAIVDTIKACENKVALNLYCIGVAASMGAVILASGPKGHRYVTEHGKIMIHEPLIASEHGVSGSATNVMKVAENIMEVKKVINEMIAACSGKSVEEVDEATSFDNYMTAKEAIEFGLADEIRTTV